MSKKGMKAIDYIAVFVLGLLLLAIIVLFSADVKDYTFEAFSNLKRAIMRGG
ncbi:MAG: hypothetical protein ABIB71_07210 [Candidatus Woesearchaeota archaeon]